MRQARGELREELARCRRVDDKDRQAPDGRRGSREDFERTVAVLREQREGDALHGTRGDYLGVTLSARQTNGGGGLRWVGARTSPRVSGSTCIERKLSRWGSADGGRVKGFEVYAGMPRKERSRISGWDSRKAAKSGSSLEGAQSASPHRPFFQKRNKGERHETYLMDVANERRRKGASRGNIHASARCRFS
jgi:hypothetical protein